LQSETFTYLTNLMPLNLQATPYDYFDRFTLMATSKPTGSVMPPGPGVEYYLEAHEMSETGLNYALQVKWEPWVRDWLIHSIPEWQVYHRSRLLAIAANELKVRELNYRIEQTREYMPYLKQAALTTRQSYEVSRIVLDATRDYLHYDPQWRTMYINEHLNSSLGGGFRWRNALDVSNDDWRHLLSILQSNLEQLQRYPEYYSHIDWYSGIRARADEIDAISPAYGNPVQTNELGVLTPQWYTTMGRSRVILFHPTMSLWTMFISQKAAWYTEVLEKVLDYLQVEGEYFFPYVLGGQIYIKAQQLFNDGIAYQANDGKSWESSQGILLGPSFRPFMVQFAGIPMLPSGETFTSMFGTIASVIATRRVKGTWLVLGDDMNHWGRSLIQVPYVEYQPGDTEHKWILGVSFQEDVNRPRISGIKMSMDRAGAMRPIHATPGIVEQSIQGRTRDPRTRVAWAGLFHGWFGDRSLIDSLSKIPPGEYISPGEYIERMVEEKTASIDPYAWAEQYGIKRIFT